HAQSRLYYGHRQFKQSSRNRKSKKVVQTTIFDLQQHGLTYFKMQDYPQAVSYYLKAYELAMSNAQPMDEMTDLNNIAIVYIRNENLNQAEVYFNRAYQIAVENNGNVIQNRHFIHGLCIAHRQFVSL